MRRSLLTLLFAALLNCNSPQNPIIPKDAKVEFVHIRDTLEIDGVPVIFYLSRNDSAFFRYYSPFSEKGGGLRYPNELAYDFSPRESLFGWGLVYLSDSAAGVASWKMKFGSSQFWK